MAITKIHPIKITLKKALNYICNPEKTDEKILISSFGCEPDTADLEFEFTNTQAVGNKGDNLAHHLIQSFDPGEVDFAEAHRIGQELADKVLQGKYEYVMTTHIDKGHVHNHLIFCATNFIDHHKYVSNDKTRYRIRNISDKLCQEHGLSVIETDNYRGKHYAEWRADKEGKSDKVMLKEAIDRYIPLSSDFEDMLRRMELDGYAIKRAKYHSYKLPDAGPKVRFAGGPSLGKEYTDERIGERIAGLVKAPQRKRKPTQAQDDKRINLIIDIQNSVKAQESRGYEKWAKLHNLKQAAKTVVFLEENDIQEYEQLTARIAEVQTAYGEAADTLKAAEKRIADMALLIKNIESYRKTLPVAKEYRQAKDRAEFFDENASTLIVHEAAKKALRELGYEVKLPNVAELKQEHKKLTQQKAALYKQYGDLKQTMKEYGTVKANIDQLLGKREPDEPSQKKEQSNEQI